MPPWEWRAISRNGAPESDVVPNGVSIVGLLPNPRDQDTGKEQMTIFNGTTNDIDLRGWKLFDRAGNKFLLSGVVRMKRRLVGVVNTGIAILS